MATMTLWTEHLPAPKNQNGCLNEIKYGNTNIIALMHIKMLLISQTMKSIKYVIVCNNRKLCAYFSHFINVEESCWTSSPLIWMTYAFIFKSIRGRSMHLFLLFWKTVFTNTGSFMAFIIFLPCENEIEQLKPIKLARSFAVFWLVSFSICTFLLPFLFENHLELGTLWWHWYAWNSRTHVLLVGIKVYWNLIENLSDHVQPTALPRSYISHTLNKTR